jgi:N utilization substance protein A
MSNLLFQTIDQISREKGIDPQIVVHAIEDAIVVASRKYFKSNEELRGRINSDTGEIDVYAIRKVVDSVTNPVREISLDEARSVKPDAQRRRANSRSPRLAWDAFPRRWPQSFQKSPRSRARERLR